MKIHDFAAVWLIGAFVMAILGKGRNRTVESFSAGPEGKLGEQKYKIRQSLGCFCSVGSANFTEFANSI